MPAFGESFVDQGLPMLLSNLAKCVPTVSAPIYKSKEPENGEVESEFAGRMHTMGLVNFTSISSDTL